jgi:hypothetical protein
VSTNGHEPRVTELADVLERTRPTRVVQIPRERLDPGSVTLFELTAVGRALGMSPRELGAIDPAGWESFDLQQALVWVILRREEPSLTWEEAQRFRLEFPPANPTEPASAGSATNGTATSSTSTASRVSGPRTRKR